jgi:hypothetical protein
MSSSSIDGVRRAAGRFAVALCTATGVLTVVLTDPAQAQEQKAVLRPEIGKPLQAAIDLVKASKGKEALAKLREVDAVGERTPRENGLIERVRGQAASLAGEPAAAARAFEAAAGLAAPSDPTRIQLLGAAAGQYHQAKAYRKAAELAAEYFKDGGTDKRLRTIYVQALYLDNNFSAAARGLAADVAADEKAGTPPAEDTLQMLSDACLKTKDDPCYVGALEKLVAYHPKQEYWLATIYAVSTRSGLAERLGLDLARLKLTTGTLRDANDYFEAAQLALQAGLPAEGKMFVERGYAAGLLGAGADAERHGRLRDMTVNATREDLASLGQSDAQFAAAKDGIAQINAGLNYVLLGKADKGLDMMEAGMKKGGLKRPDDARLRLGYAYFLAGQNAKAAQVFRTVQGADGTAALARLWLLKLSKG